MSTIAASVRVLAFSAVILAPAGAFAQQKGAPAPAAQAAPPASRPSARVAVVAGVIGAVGAAAIIGHPNVRVVEHNTFAQPEVVQVVTPPPAAPEGVRWTTGNYGPGGYERQERVVVQERVVEDRAPGRVVEVVPGPGHVDPGKVDPGKVLPGHIDPNPVPGKVVPVHVDPNTNRVGTVGAPMHGGFNLKLHASGLNQK